MNFQEFQASKQRITTQEYTIRCGSSNDECFTGKEVFCYEGMLYIDINENGSYHLHLERDEYESMDLEQLELELYEYGQTGGFFENHA